MDVAAVSAVGLAAVGSLSVAGYSHHVEWVRESARRAVEVPDLLKDAFVEPAGQLGVPLVPCDLEGRAKVSGFPDEERGLALQGELLLVDGGAAPGLEPHLALGSAFVDDQDPKKKLVRISAWAPPPMLALEFGTKEEACSWVSALRRAAKQKAPPGRIQELFSHVDTERRHNVDLQGFVSKLKQEREQLEGKVEKANSKIADLKEELEMAQKEIATHKKMSSEKKAEAEAGAYEHTDHSKVRNHLSAIREALEGARRVQKANAPTGIDSVALELDELRQSLARSNAEVADLKQEAQQYYEWHQEAQEGARMWQSRCQGLEAKLAASKQAPQEAQEDAMMWQSRCETLEAKLAASQRAPQAQEDAMMWQSRCEALEAKLAASQQASQADGMMWQSRCEALEAELTASQQAPQEAEAAVKMWRAMELEMASCQRIAAEAQAMCKAAEGNERAALEAVAAAEANRQQAVAMMQASAEEVFQAKADAEALRSAQAKADTEAEARKQEAVAEEERVRREQEESVFLAAAAHAMREPAAPASPSPIAMAEQISLPSTTNAEQWSGGALGSSAPQLSQFSQPSPMAVAASVQGWQSARGAPLSQPTSPPVSPGTPQAAQNSRQSNLSATVSVQPLSATRVSSAMPVSPARQVSPTLRQLPPQWAPAAPAQPQPLRSVAAPMLQQQFAPAALVQQQWAAPQQLYSSNYLLRTSPNL